MKVKTKTNMDAVLKKKTANQIRKPPNTGSPVHEKYVILRPLHYT